MTHLADPDALKARAAALFRDVAQDHRDALAEDRARVERERAKMARLRAARLEGRETSNTQA